jgi:hypothetical protein
MVRWLFKRRRRSSKTFANAVHDLWVIHHARIMLARGDEDGARRLMTELKFGA